MFGEQEEKQKNFKHKLNFEYTNLNTAIFPKHKEIAAINCITFFTEETNV